MTAGPGPCKPYPNSVQVRDVKAYFRIYERDEHGHMRAIPLDVAAL